MKLEIHHFETLDSTQTMAKSFIQDGAFEGTVVIADKQEFGVGRMNRPWASPVGNLYTSIVLTPQEHKNAPAIADYGQIALMTGVAAQSGIIDHFKNENKMPPQIQLKWPNDGFIDGKKVFGILVECFADAVIVGIGINVNAQPDTIGNPVSLKNAMGDTDTDIDVTAIFHAILKAFFKYYRQWLAGDFDAIRTEWLEHAYGLNESVTRNTDEVNTTTGTFVGLALSGAMQIKQTDGTIVDVYS